MKLLLLAIVLASAVHAQRRVTTEAAWTQLGKGDRAGAQRTLRAILEENATDGEALLMLGSILFEDGQVKVALPLLQKAATVRPQSAEAHQAYGDALRASGDRDAARKEFARAVTLNPKFAQARVDLGLMLIEDGDSSAAAAHLDRAIAVYGRSPDSAFPRYLRAKITAEANEFERAVADLKIAVQLQPRFAEAWGDLGQAFKALHDDDGALAAFEKAVALDSNPVAEYRLGAEYLRRGRTRDAIAHLEESLKLKPDDQATLYSLQLALREDGQLDRARQVKEQLAIVLRRIDEESQRAFKALGLNNEGAALEKAGDLKGALARYREASALDPAHRGIRTNYAVALLRSGEWEAGLALLKRAVAEEPGNAQLRAALADALEQAPVQFGGKGKARKPE